MKHSVFIIGTVWVEPNASAAGSRMLQIIQFFLAQKWQVTFGCAAQKSDNSTNLKNLGVAEVAIALNNSDFDAYIKKLNPSIVVFDRFLTEEQFGWRVTENCPNALRILDTEDLHFLRKVRHQLYKKDEDFNDKALLISEDAKREIASILRCDLSLIISPFEMDLLTSVFKIDERLLLYLPFMLDAIEEHQTKKWKPFEERKHFVFIGNYQHKPNVDAVLSLKNRVWSIIKQQLPEVEMHVYGAYVTQQIKELHNEKEGFLIKGFAENASQILENAKVLLAFLNFGAGLKGKLMDAMLAGTPNVTTTIGAEGMHCNLPWSGVIANNEKDFAAEAIAFYTNKNRWLQSQKCGIEIINSIYNKQKWEALFLEKINHLFANIEAHKTQNFLGSLLQHQTLQATKYMSKWIEEKNKKY